MPKPHLKLVGGQLIEVERDLTPAMQEARRKFGKPFAIEPGSTWKPRSTRLLTEWLSKRVNGSGK